MKHFKITNKSLLLVAAIAVSMVSCGKLDPTAKEAQAIVEATADAPVPAPSLGTVYNQLNQFVGQGNWFAMNEHSTDELMGPTRGTDWDDFGTWRKLHLHTWDGSHNQVNDTWNGLQTALANSTLLAESTTAAAADKNEARFLRAFFTYQQMDLFGVVQHRPATALSKELPLVYTRSEAIDYLIAELTVVMPTLPAYTPATRNKASKEAAQFLLAKALLNKAVYKAAPASPAGPFTFASAEMTQVITLCNQIATNAALSVDPSYWDNFVWDNGTKSSENIFVRKNSDGINMVWASCMGNHYTMTPDGWNGFTTLADFYNSFEAGDVRREQNLAGFTNLTGRPAGFLVGQQRGPTAKTIGNPIVDLKDRSGNPLIFTSNASLFFSDESKGIRTNKYPLNPAEMNGGGWGSANEYPFMRFSDVRLMKAEAILRGGTDANAETPLSIVNAIRTLRSATPLASVTLTNLLAERGRELYLEAVRRNDLIRFGKFNDPVIERATASAPTKVVYPIPNIALSSNPNLKQNEGY
jgi:starch-binding outer membrane protein, SusD/RagB family